MQRMKARDIQMRNLHYINNEDSEEKSSDEEEPLVLRQAILHGRTDV